MHRHMDSSHELERISSSSIHSEDSQESTSILSNHADSTPSWRVVLEALRGPQRLWSTALPAVLASISPLLGGYATGFSSPALLQLNDPQTPAKYHLKDVALAMFSVRLKCDCLLYVYANFTPCNPKFVDI